MDIKTISVALGLIITLVTTTMGVVSYADEKYADKQQTIESIQEVRIQMLESELDRLSLKEKTEKLSEYEQLRKEQIIRDLKKLIN